MAQPKALIGSSSTLYEVVREEIIKRIKNGTYKPEELIPSASALSDEFNVSPITVKRALQDLRSAGFLISIAGKGSFVKKQSRVLRKLDVSRLVLGGDSLKLLSITREKITDATMLAFNPPSEPMLCIRKIVYIDDAPFLYDATYISRDVGDDLIEEFGKTFVISALEKRSIQVTNTDLIIDAAPAGGQVEDVFGIPTGYPLLRRFYKFTTNHKDITVYGMLQAPFDQLACTISLPGKPTK
ncbi:GntR family transcriptional regulator [Rhizobium miluonense]|uniref:DNA-binding transcriptional regulator, GntR family n=1 Tax=Rhizobium miluonense TaxID=411945 RepID=A0A1C3WZY3_9HYPH|nr:GntR family transcriptional regulator [Rhizobium miluonense]SCB45541.1 DNA-binding transcriptional regulator, GntR family [Rhizobium miluonense]